MCAGVLSVSSTWLLALLLVFWPTMAAATSSYTVLQPSPTSVSPLELFPMETAMLGSGMTFSEEGSMSTIVEMLDLVPEPTSLAPIILEPVPSSMTDVGVATSVTMTSQSAESTEILFQVESTPIDGLFPEATIQISPDPTSTQIFFIDESTAGLQPLPTTMPSPSPVAMPTATPSPSPPTDIITVQSSFSEDVFPLPSLSLVSSRIVNTDFLQPFLTSELNQLQLTTVFVSSLPSLLTSRVPSPSSFPSPTALPSIPPPSTMPSSTVTELMPESTFMFIQPEVTSSQPLLSDLLTSSQSSLISSTVDEFVPFTSSQAELLPLLTPTPSAVSPTTLFTTFSTISSVPDGGLTPLPTTTGVLPTLTTMQVEIDPSSSTVAPSGPITTDFISLTSLVSPSATPLSSIFTPDETPISSEVVLTDSRSIPMVTSTVLDTTSFDILVPVTTRIGILVPESSSVVLLTSMDLVVSTGEGILVPESTSVESLVPESTTTTIMPGSASSLISSGPLVSSRSSSLPSSIQDITPSAVPTPSPSAPSTSDATTRLTSDISTPSPSGIPTPSPSAPSTSDVPTPSPSGIPTPSPSAPSTSDVPTPSPSGIPTPSPSASSTSDVPTPSPSGLVITSVRLPSMAPSTTTEITDPSTAVALSMGPSISMPVDTVPSSSVTLMTSSSPTPQTTLLPMSDSTPQPGITSAPSIFSPTPLRPSDSSPSPPVTSSPSIGSTSSRFTSSLAPPTVSPSPPPNPGCPSLQTPNTIITELHRVSIGLALTPSEHEVLTTPNSQRLCDLEVAIVDVLLLGFRVQVGGVKRQVDNIMYDADITDLSDLSLGSSTITFHVLSALDTTSDPTGTPLSADVVAMAISAANVQAIETYPIVVPAMPVGVTTSSTPVATSSLLLPLVAGVGGAVILLLLLLILFIVCFFAICYRKKGLYDIQAIQSVESGRTFSESRDFQSYRQNTVGIQHGTPVIAPRGKGRGVVSTNGWMEGETSDKVPAGLFERVAHYDTPPPPTGPSPPIRGLRMRMRNSIAPSPSASNKSQSSEGVATPAALRPGCSSAARAAEAKKLREEALRLQEEQEERELKTRRRATLQRLLLQSRERDTRSRGSQRSRHKKRGAVAPLPSEGDQEDLSRPPLPHRPDWSLGQDQLDAALGDAETSPVAGVPAATSSPRPPTKRRQMRSRKSNRVGPLPPTTTDGYDSTDLHRKPPVSRQSSKRFKSGRSQRGRPFTQQSMAGGGRVSRGVAYDAQQELAWMDTGRGGVQLMRLQPLISPAPPTYSLPPHPQTPSIPPASRPVVQVQPRPQEAGSLAQERLPALTEPRSQSYTQRQLETYFKIHQEMERLQLHNSTPAPLRTQDTPTKPRKATPTKEQEELKEAGVEVPPTPSLDHTHVPPDTPLGPLEDSYSSTIHELMQHMLNTSGGMGRGQEGGARTTSSLAREDSIDYQLPSEQLFTPARAWHPSQVATPYQLYVPPPPTHYATAIQPAYTPTQGQLLWAPTEPHPMAPPTNPTHVNAQMLTPAQLSQLRRNQDQSWNGMESYPPASHCLPSHSQIRNQKDPFQ